MINCVRFASSSKGYDSKNSTAKTKRQNNKNEWINVSILHTINGMTPLLLVAECRYLLVVRDQLSNRCKNIKLVRNDTSSVVQSASGKAADTEILFLESNHRGLSRHRYNRRSTKLLADTDILRARLSEGKNN